jgi:hypothetical protein
MRLIQNPVSKEVTVQVRPAVPKYESPDSKESGLFYVQKIMFIRFLHGSYSVRTSHIG